ncbi:MAG: CDP-glycerol glycerophosphotransferase family protein [Selenomonadaceae bacterium]|nr:CDP-glycerol glycerophosphotransferase family protein [Selenomonadaceae bacterium]
MNNIQNKIYIFKRELLAWVNRIAFYICRIFPVKKKLIAVCSFEGKGGFGCNPKYIVRELQRRNNGFEFVWLVNDLQKEFPEYISKVPNTLWHRAYWLSRARIWIDNYRTPYGTIKRSGQFYINVNHYTLSIKCTGLLRGEKFSTMAYKVSRNDSKTMDALVIDSIWGELISPRGLLFAGPYLKIGAPRCDALNGEYVQNARKYLRKKHGLAEDAKIVMYAPTFREEERDGKRSVFKAQSALDFSRLLSNLTKRFGGTWHLCTRFHPQVAEQMLNVSSDLTMNNAFDESQADDLYEILPGVDAYITDYSSASFEACLARIPVFLYADDVKEYCTSRGGLMWDFLSTDRKHITNNKALLPSLNIALPFTMARNNDELEYDVLNFNSQVYSNNIKIFVNKLGVVFDGKASARLADIIESL